MKNVKFEVVIQNSEVSYLFRPVSCEFLINRRYLLKFCHHNYSNKRLKKENFMYATILQLKMCLLH